MTIIELNDKEQKAIRAHDRKSSELDKKVGNIAAATKQLDKDGMDHDAREKLYYDVMTDLGIISQIANEMAGICYEYSRLLSDIARASEISWPPTVKSLDRKAGA